MQEDDIERSERQIIMFCHRASLTRVSLPMHVSAQLHRGWVGLITHAQHSLNSLQRTLMKIEALTSTSGCVKSTHVHQILCLQNQSHYMSQNLLRGNNETNDLQRWFVTIIHNRILYFHGLKWNIFVVRDNRQTLCLKTTPFLVKKVMNLQQLNVMFLTSQTCQSL